MEESSATRFLKGKNLPDNASPVRTVLKSADVRLVLHEDGSHTVLSKRQLANRFDKVLQSHQRAQMEQTLNQHGNKTTVKIGGHIKGETREYKTKAAAKAALTRAYGKPSA